MGKEKQKQEHEREPKQGGKSKRRHPMLNCLFVLMIGLAALLLVVGLFHRAIIRLAIHQAAQQFAKQNKLEIDFTISGSFFTNFELTDLEIDALPGSTFPLKHVEVGLLESEYDLWTLYHERDLRTAVEKVVLHDTKVVIKPPEVMGGAKKRPPKNPDAAPAPFLIPNLPRNVEVRNLSVILLKAGTDDLNQARLRLAGAHLELGENQSGTLGAREVQFPATNTNLRPVKMDVKLGRSRVDLRGVKVGTYVMIDGMALDLGGEEAGPMGLSFRGRFFEARGEGTVQFWRGEEPDLRASVAFADINLTALGRVFARYPIPAGKLELFQLQVGGNPNKPRTLGGNLWLELRDAVYEGHRLETLSARMNLRDGMASMPYFTAESGKNFINLTAQAILPEEGWDLKDFRAMLSFRLSAFELEEIAEKHGLDAGGRFVARGEAVLEDARLKEGSAAISGSLLRWGERRFGSMRLDLAADHQGVQVDHLLWWMPGRFSFTLEGYAGFEPPHPYQVALDGRFLELAYLEDLIHPESEVKWVDSGSGGIHLEGQGAALDPESHDLELTVETENLSVDLPEDASRSGVAQSLAGRQDFGIDLQARLKNARLEVTRFLIAGRGRNLVKLQGEVPLQIPPEKDPDAPPLFDELTPVNVQAEIDELDSTTVEALTGLSLPVTGIVSLKLDLSGSLNEPAGELLLAAREVTLHELELDLDPAELDLRAVYEEDGAAAFNLQARQSLFDEPLALRGRTKLNLNEVLAKGKLDLDQPLALRMTLPPTDLSAVGDVLPGVESIEGGIVGMDAAITGSLKEPKLEGQIELRADAVRPEKTEFPEAQGIESVIELDQKEIRVRQLRAILAGGVFAMSGVIDITELTDPAFDLRFESREALLVRNQATTIRANTNLSVQGRMEKADLSGEIVLVHSDYQLDVNFLPNLRGAPPPIPPQNRRTKRPSFRGTFLENWNLDVAFRSPPNDPFRIRGNFARGSLMPELQLVGPGRNIQLQGDIDVREFTLVFPFSELRAAGGTVKPNPDNILDPFMNVTLQTRMQGYLVNVLLTGTLSNPQPRFSSVPPLSQEQIATLLATGSVEGTLEGGEGAGAQRALTYVLREIYRRLTGNRRFIDEGLLNGRLSIRSEGANPSTGAERTTATLELSDRYEVRTSVETDGSFRGVLQYLIRF